MRALLLLIIAFGVFLLVRFIMKRVNEIRRDEIEAEHKAQQQTLSHNTERMVTCAECGVRLPESEAIPLAHHSENSTDANNKPIVFCSQEHKRQYLEKHPEA